MKGNKEVFLCCLHVLQNVPKVVNKPLKCICVKSQAPPQATTPNVPIPHPRSAKGSMTALSVDSSALSISKDSLEEGQLLLLLYILLLSISEVRSDYMGHNYTHAPSTLLSHPPTGWKSILGGPLAFSLLIAIYANGCKHTLWS